MHKRLSAAAMVLPLAWMLAAPSLAQTAELKPETLAAFDRYVRQAERRMEDDLRAAGPFLLPDGWPLDRRNQAYQELHRGGMLIERLDNGTEARVPHGLIHHWAGVAFISGATLNQALTLIQDYDHHQDIYAPEVLRSHLVRRQGDDFHFLLRLRKHKVVTVVLDTEYDVHFARLDPHRAYSWSHSTRIAEVEDPGGGGGERDLPPGNDHGFLWALDTYWRFLQVDDGVFIQCEAISLTRDVPTGLSWLIGPFIESIPRESLEFTLATTRKAVAERQPAVASREIR